MSDVFEEFFGKRLCKMRIRSQPDNMHELCHNEAVEGSDYCEFHGQNQIEE